MSRLLSLVRPHPSPLPEERGDEAGGIEHSHCLASHSQRCELASLSPGERVGVRANIYQNQIK